MCGCLIRNVKVSIHALSNSAILCRYNRGVGARGGVVVKALRYKPAGRGFDSRCCHWNF